MYPHWKFTLWNRTVNTFTAILHSGLFYFQCIQRLHLMLGSVLAWYVHVLPFQDCATNLLHPTSTVNQPSSGQYLPGKTICKTTIAVESSSPREDNQKKWAYIWREKLCRLTLVNMCSHKNTDFLKTEICYVVMNFVYCSAIVYIVFSFCWSNLCS